MKRKPKPNDDAERRQRALIRMEIIRAVCPSMPDQQVQTLSIALGMRGF